MPVGPGLAYTKQYNHRIIIETIRQHGPVSRAEIAQMTGLTPSMITGLTGELLKEDIIIQTGRRKGQRGQPAINLEMNPDGRFSLGFELARDHLSGVVINLAGEILDKTHVEWRHPAPEEALPLIVHDVKQLLKRANIPVTRVLGVGIAMPGPFLSDDRTVVSPTNFPGWKQFPLADKLADLLNFPILLENDAIAAAIGEHFHGAGQAYQTFFYLYFGAALGGAMLSQGFPYRGFSPNTGEVRRIKHGAQGRRDVIGQFLGVHDLYKFLHNQNITVSTPQELITLFHGQDTYFWGWLNEAVDRLDTILHAINALLGPEVIFFGGRFPEELIEYLIERLQIEAAATKASQPDRDLIYLPPLLRASSGELSSTVGAATLPLYTSFSLQHTILQQHNHGSYT